MLRKLKSLWTVATLVLVAACAAPPDPDSIRASHQPVMEALDPPWSAIGRITFSHAWAPGTTGYIRRGRLYSFTCTGTLIGPREVLTAAHCLWDRLGNKWASLVRLTFEVGPLDGQFSDSSFVTAYRILPRRRADRTFTDPAVDWAVLTLSRNLGERYGFLPVAIFDQAMLEELNRAQAPFIHAAYGAEEPRLLVINEHCDVPGFSSDGRVALYQCKTMDGDSGSPILVKAEDGYAIVAIHSGVFQWRNEEYGVGIPGRAAFLDPVRRTPYIKAPASR